jgi:hypothetical protein
MNIKLQMQEEENYNFKIKYVIDYLSVLFSY